MVLTGFCPQSPALYPYAGTFRIRLPHDLATARVPVPGYSVFYLCSGLLCNAFNMRHGKAEAIRKGSYISAHSQILNTIFRLAGDTRPGWCLSDADSVSEWPADILRHGAGNVSCCRLRAVKKCLDVKIAMSPPPYRSCRGWAEPSCVLLSLPRVSSSGAIRRRLS